MTLTEAQLGGGGRARALLYLRGGPPLQNEKKERMAKISITRIRKPIELLQKFYYTIIVKNFFYLSQFSRLKAIVNI